MLRSVRIKRLLVVLTLGLSEAIFAADGGSCAYAPYEEVAVLMQGEMGIELITAQGPAPITLPKLQALLLKPTPLNHYAILKQRYLVEGGCVPHQFVGLQLTPIVEYQSTQQQAVQALMEEVLEAQSSTLDGPNICYRSHLSELMQHWRSTLPDLFSEADTGLMAVCYYLGDSIGDKAHALLLTTDSQGKPLSVADHYQTFISH